MDYHYYFKVTIGFQCLTTINTLWGARDWMGMLGEGGGGGGGACVDPGWGGGLDPIGKAHVI